MVHGVQRPRIGSTAMSAIIASMQYYQHNQHNARTQHMHTCVCVTATLNGMTRVNGIRSLLSSHSTLGQDSGMQLSPRKHAVITPSPSPLPPCLSLVWIVGLMHACIELMCVWTEHWKGVEYDVHMTQIGKSDWDKELGMNEMGIIIII